MFTTKYVLDFNDNNHFAKLTCGNTFNCFWKLYCSCVNCIINIIIITMINVVFEVASCVP